MLDSWASNFVVFSFKKERQDYFWFLKKILPRSSPSSRRFQRRWDRSAHSVRYSSGWTLSRCRRWNCTWQTTSARTGIAARCRPAAAPCPVRSDWSFCTCGYCSQTAADWSAADRGSAVRKWKMCKHFIFISFYFIIFLFYYYFYLLFFKLLFFYYFSPTSTIISNYCCLKLCECNALF